MRNSKRHRPHRPHRPVETPRDIYQEVTDKIIAALERGVLPWQRGWDQVACGAPMNPTTGRVYRGINNLMLGLTQDLRFNGDPRWCSYRQAKERGWQVRKGETATTVVFYKRCLRKGDAGNASVGGDAGGSGGHSHGGGDDNRYFRLLRTSPVFHASQMDNVPVYCPPDLSTQHWRTPEAVETILTNSGARIDYGGSSACFIPAQDCIRLPPKAAFRSDAAFAYTALHELSHYAYAAPRLNLSQGGRFGSAAYAFEELVVSIASVNVCTVIGVAAEIENTASYAADWLTVLKSEKKAIFRAAADAQRVADYLLAFHPDYAASVAASAYRDDQDDDALAEIDHEDDGPLELAEAA